MDKIEVSKSRLSLDPMGNGSQTPRGGGPPSLARSGRMSELGATQGQALGNDKVANPRTDIVFAGPAPAPRSRVIVSPLISAKPGILTRGYEKGRAPHLFLPLPTCSCPS